MPCNYCNHIESMTGVRHCPIHQAPPPIAGVADVERESKLDAERVTLEFGSKSTRRLDAGRRPIDESPLFGGASQQEMF